MIDQKRILTLNIRKYMQANGIKMKNMAEKMGFKTAQSLQNILTGNANPSWVSLIALCNATNVSLDKWFSPDEEIFGLEKSEETNNDFLADLKAYQQEQAEDDKVKVIFDKDERYIEFNNKKIPTSDFDFSNITAKYGEIVLTVDVLVDVIEKRHGTTDKG